MHELDLALMQYHVDVSTHPGDTRHGDRAAKDVLSWLKQNGKNISSDARYLALGAGQAYHEEAFAHHLGISPNRITMVDLKFQDYSKRRLELNLPGAELVESGLFTHLANPPKRDFSLVSAFGIEYVLCRNGAIETLIESVSGITSSYGIVYLSFYMGRNVDNLWRKNGFDVIHGYEDFLNRQMYVRK